MSRFLARIGRGVSARPWLTIVTFILSLLILGGVAGAVGAGYSTDVNLGNSDSQSASDLLKENFPAAAGDSALVVLHSSDAASLEKSAKTGEVSSALKDIADISVVDSVTPLQFSSDGTTAFTNVVYTKPASELNAEALTALETAVKPISEAGFEVSMRGPVVDRWRVREMPVGEALGLVAAIILVAIMFRSFAATAVTIGSALIALILGNSVLAVVSGFIDIPSVAPTIAIMLGLGAGIDYALFLVARFRKRLREGDTVKEAVVNANLSTGASVLTAGAIVVVSILGLYVTGIEVISRMGLAAAIVVATAAIASVTLTPALLRLVGKRVLPKRERRGEAAFDSSEADAREGRSVKKVALAMARRPWLSAIGATIVLLVLAAPTLNLQLGQPDDSNRPVGDTMRVAYERVADSFGVGYNGPLIVAVDLTDSNDGSSPAESLASDLAKADGVAQVAPVQLNDAKDTAVITVIPDSAPQSVETSQLVERLRSEVIPESLDGTGVVAHVGGQTATFDDLASKVSASLGALVAAVIGLSLVLLFFAFRSIWLPVVSAVMNVLSILAAYGVVTLAFQTPWGAQLLGVNEQPVVSFVPMLMFAILFGLSMDYNVFLISTVREMKEKGLSAKDAVIEGIRRTGTLITTAGVIMTIVFLGFTMTSETEVKMIGLGLAVAVVIDVTLVRLVLTPSVLTLLGERAWWLPKWLDKRLPKGAALTH
ncbi:MAG: MMPL family transporter [Actinobacteria bacterium]|nr:MMPL family transporter [Actinomycetota bacterium]